MEGGVKTWEIKSSKRINTKRTTIWNIKIHDIKLRIKDYIVTMSKGTEVLHILLF